MIIYNNQCYLVDTQVAKDTGDSVPVHRIDPNTGDLITTELGSTEEDKGQLTKCRVSNSFKRIKDDKGDIVPTRMKISFPPGTDVKPHTRIKLEEMGYAFPILRADYKGNVLGVVEYIVVYI